MRKILPWNEHKSNALQNLSCIKKFESFYIRKKTNKKEQTDINETRYGLPCHKVPQSDDKLPHLSQTVNQQSDQFPIDWCSQASGNEYVYDTGKKPVIIDKNKVKILEWISFTHT